MITVSMLNYIKQSPNSTYDWRTFYENPNIPYMRRGAIGSVVTTTSTTSRDLCRNSMNHSSDNGRY